MKKKHWLLAIAVLVLTAALLIWYGISQLNKPEQSEGTFVFELIDKDNTKLIRDEVEFKKSDNLVTIMIEKYDVKYENTTYGTWIQDINNVIGETSYYLALYINEEYSSIGVDDVVLIDKMVISWIATAF